MKILKLKFKNINSLADVNEIDFTDAGFIDNGIFAITGKTGAGKSSILDAISLALYGKTPRIEITGNENAVMTFGTSDCFSEVIFEAGGKQYISSWKQELTRTGKLKPVNRQIAEITGKIIADQVRSCDNKIIEILRLTFEQFTKVIMLAQGSFAAFLQANKNDKGELLEQITGTEIYGEISKKVFERNKTEIEKLKQIDAELGAIKILSEEEIKTLNNDIVEYGKQKLQLDAELQIIETAKHRLKDLLDLQKQIGDAKIKLPYFQQKVETAKTSFEQAEKTLKSLKEEKEKVEFVWKNVRELDIKILEKKNILKPVIDQLTKLENDINKSNVDLNTQNISCKKIEEILHNNTELLKNKNEELENKKFEILQLLGGKQIADYHREKEQITLFGKEIKNLIDNLKAASSHKKEIINNENVIKSNLQKVKELSEKIKIDKTAVENLEKQISLLRENIALSERIKSLEEQRKLLKDGEECPLCGSTEHPFVKGNIPLLSNKKNELNSLTLQLKSKNKAILDNENALTKMNSDNENAEKNKKAEQNKLQENEIKTKQILEEIAQSGQNISAILESDNCTEALEEIRQQKLQSYTSINEKIKSVENLENNIRKLRDIEILKITSELEIKKNELVNLKTGIATLQTLILEKQTQSKAQNAYKENMEKESKILSKQRYDLFENKKVEDEEKHFKDSIEKAEKAQIKAEEFKTTANTEFEKNKAIINEKEKELTEKQAKNTTEKTFEELQKEFEDKKKLSDDFSQKIGASHQSLIANEKNIKNGSEKLKAKELQQAICNKWANLNDLIGSSDGKKYRNFAQALTFEHLIDLTNIQLQKMSQRYILKRAGDISNPFELFVIDKFQNCEERTVQNLSGGEKFIVSLSLALGLANMAGKNMKIDTMFIDEGFGTLDLEYLDTALSALSNLQNEGKLIGVISHLTELKERITTHIEVLPTGNGYSKIRILAN